MGSRLSFPHKQQSAELRGRWVALDNCRYDTKTGQPVEGTIVDSDEDLVELCTRIKQGDNKHCAILFCEEVPESGTLPVLSEDNTPPPSSVRRASVPPQH